MKKLWIVLLLFSFIGCQQCFGTVSSTATVERFTANGSATTFNFTFRLTDQAEMTALVRADSTGIDTALTLNVDYTLAATNNDFSSGGTLTTSVTYASGNTLILHRDALRTQTVNLIQGQSLPAESTETTFDKQTMAIQDIDKDLIFYISVPFGDPTTALTLELPSSVDRASRTFTFDSDGNPTVTDSTTGVTVTAYAETYLDDASEAAFKVTTNLETGIDLQAWDTQLDDIAALAVTNSNFIVGDGTNWVAESGATARTSLGLTIGTNVHAYTANGNTILTDAGILSVAGLTTAADKMIYTTASDTYTVTDLTSFSRTLLDDATAAEARTTLGVVASGESIDRDGSVVYTGTGVGFKDEDNMSSDSAVATASQQSINAFVNNKLANEGVQAWVNFDGDDASINGSFNVTGVNRDSQGNYTITWATDFADTTYVVTGLCGDTGAQGFITYASDTPLAAGTTAIRTVNVSAAAIDFNVVTIMAIGTQ